MAFDQIAADRVRRQLVEMGYVEIEEKQMFGGVTFLYKGKMSVGVVKDELAVRVMAEKMDQYLEEPFVRPMDFTKRPMKEFIFVSPEGYDTDLKLREFISLGVEHAESRS